MSEMYRKARDFSWIAYICCQQQRFDCNIINQMTDMIQICVLKLYRVCLQARTVWHQVRSQN